MERMDIIVEEYGLKLGKTSERLCIRRGEEVIFEKPLTHIRSIMLYSRGISLSTDLIASCARYQIPVSICEREGSPLARVVIPSVEGEAKTRRMQLEISRDGDRGFILARQLVAEKCRGQLRMMRYLERRVSGNVMLYREDMERLTRHGKRVVSVECWGKDHLDEALDRLMGHEGMAARAYWSAWGSTLGVQSWQGRTKRGATDSINMALNYGYAILREQVWGMIERAHLDAYSGVLHRDRGGRPGLVLDVMEPWRILVEDAVGSMARRSKSVWMEEGELSTSRRREIADSVLGRLNSPASFGKRRARVAACMQQSVREVARYIRGEVETPRLYRWDVRGPKEPVGDGELDELERLFCRTGQKR